MKFNHIGIFVPNLEFGKKHLENIFKLEKWSVPIKDPIQKVVVQFGYDEANICYEIIAPDGFENPVDDLLKQNKNLLNHIAYNVNNIDQSIIDLRNNGCILVTGPSPASAFNYRKIAFLLTPLKFIIELIEN